VPDSPGLHASISIHICHDYLDQTTGEWAPNLECFVSRLATHPERLSNVYFNAVLLLRAVARAAPYLEAYDIGTAPLVQSADPKVMQQCSQDAEAKTALDTVLQLAKGDGTQKAFDEADFFTSNDAPVGPRVEMRRYGVLIIAVERAVQDALPKCLADHGLCRMRQVQTMGETPGLRPWHSPEDPLRAG